jgi:hypothetical protein
MCYFSPLIQEGFTKEKIGTNVCLKFRVKKEHLPGTRKTLTFQGL